MGRDATAKGAGPDGTRERENSWLVRELLLCSFSFYRLFFFLLHCNRTRKGFFVVVVVVVVCRKRLHDTQTFRERKAKRSVKGIPANDYSRGRDEAKRISEKQSKSRSLIQYIIHCVMTLDDGSLVIDFMVHC